MSRLDRRLVAIVAADVVGYSRLMSVDEQGTLSYLQALRAEIINPKIAQFEGQLVGTAGDSLLMMFPSAIDAVQFAVEMQERITDRNTVLAEDRRMTFRIGVNLGEVIFADNTIYGNGVNIAARLEKVSQPGGVVLGRAVYEQVRDKIPYKLADLGDHVMKNIAEPVRAYRVAMLNRQDDLPVVAEELPLPSKPSIAVLPFTNMSGDQEQEYFADGITEDIITELSRSSSLFVIARNSSFVFKGRAVDITEVGRALGVRYVVEGSVRKAGARVRITAQLIEASTGNHVWAERFDRKLEDLFAVQDDVTERITWALVGKVGTAEIHRSKLSKTRLEAYDTMLRGVEALNRFTAKDAAVAIEFLQSAVRLEPSSSRAQAWLAEAYATLSAFGADPSTKALSLHAAQKAVALGDPSGHAEAILAAHCGWKGDFETAETHLDRALTLGPTNPEILAWAGFICLWQGQIAQACEIGERLKRLDPLDPRSAHELLAFAYYLQGDYSASLDSFRRWNNDHYDRGYANLSACLAQVGRIDEAKAAWRKCLDCSPGFTLQSYAAGSPYSRQEDIDHWLAGLAKAGVE